MEIKHEWNENRIQNPKGAHCSFDPGKKEGSGGITNNIRIRSGIQTTSRLASSRLVSSRLWALLKRVGLRLGA